ncbi:MAG: pantoate--beta-alanine ligase [Muribaculaceae bacterium]|nr:pantoate--beta-alanine ligase [Muribaculaceae bacterium]HAP50194.1 pantoate--beta-alanine ligase [Porphyromonadaceae bacterium]
MKIISKVDELKAVVAQAKAAGKLIGLVPTMGALHLGHRSLVERARRECDVVVVSVFLNPTQFNNQEDLRTYPRTAEADAAMLHECGVDIAFMPTVEDMYPEPDTRQFHLGTVAEVMEGAYRPGHFNGVCQVVSKLFTMVEPHRAYFGEKDFQQIAVIRAMAAQQGFSLDIVACPCVREDDGLALSSRNVRLTPQVRRVAPAIYRTLRESLNFAQDHTVQQTHDWVVATINAYPEMEVEYFSICDGTTLEPVDDWNASADIVGCITVYCGDVREIDNIRYK